MEVLRFMTRKSLTIVIPVYNEEIIIERFFNKLAPVYRRLSENQEVSVLVVNNGSTDSSMEKLEKIAYQYESLGVLTLTRNFGYETALIAGLSHSISDTYALCDADGEDPVEMLIDFQEEVLKNTEIALGIRRERYEGKITKTFRNLSYRILSKLADDPFRKNAGNFSMFSLQVRNAILVENNSFPFLRSTLSRSGYSTKEFVHDRNPRIDGKSKYRKVNLVKFAIAGFMTATTWPLRFISFAAAFNFATFLIYLLTSLLSTSTLEENWFYYFLILFSLTEILLFLGVISLYLARVYKNSLGRPLFYIDWLRSLEIGRFRFEK